MARWYPDFGHPEGNGARPCGTYRLVPTAYLPPVYG